MGDQQTQRVLVTGIASELAGRLVARLEADERISYLAGVDLVEPTHDLDRTEFIRADLRNPLVAKVVESTRVDTIVHLALTAAPQDAGGRSRMKELNVIGSLQLLAAAQNAPLLRKVVVKSTTSVYGASHRAPALLREDTETEAPAQYGYTKDAIEVEGYARAFGRRRADVTLTLLRFANLVGPTVSSPLTRYLELPVVPTVLGYDPRIQLCHEDDAVELLVRSVLDTHPGIFNAAGPGVIYLSQALRLAGKPTAPVPGLFANGAAMLIRRLGGLDFSPEQLQFLRYGRVGDITRMREAFGYEPRHTTRSAFEDFVAQRIRGPLTRERLEALERAALDLFDRAGALVGQPGHPAPPGRR